MRHRTVLIICLATASTLTTASVAYFVPPVRHTLRTTVTTTTARMAPTATESFPDIDTAGLSVTQQKIVGLTRIEYQKHPVSYDQNVSVYTQNNEEAWCADFASWIMRSADIPFSNPHSGSWRIPGVYTLQEYFESQNRYQPAGTYTPKTGDIVFLHGPGGHVAIVLSVDGESMLTIGGNENGHMRISKRSILLGKEGLIGFGTLPRE